MALTRINFDENGGKFVSRHEMGELYGVCTFVICNDYAIEVEHGDNCKYHR